MGRYPRTRKMPLMTSYEFKHLRIPASLPMRPDASVDAEMDKALNALSLYGWEIKGMWLYEQSAGPSGGKYGYFHEVFLQRRVDEPEPEEVAEVLSRVAPLAPAPATTDVNVSIEKSSDDSSGAVTSKELASGAVMSVQDVAEALGVVYETAREYLQPHWALPAEKAPLAPDEINENLRKGRSWKWVIERDAFEEWKQRVWIPRQARANVRGRKKKKPPLHVKAPEGVNDARTP